MSEASEQQKNRKEREGEVVSDKMDKKKLLLKLVQGLLMLFAEP